MAKPKGSAKLKVFSTPIGFHDALVAAPSQKAALDAWGAGTNLFSQGSAHIVTDPKLTKIPLEHPGQVVKVLRGSEAEQLAALDRQKAPKRANARKAEVLPKKSKKRSPRPSRAALARAESALQKLETKQASESDTLDREIKALEQRRRDLKRRQERTRDEARERVEDERSNYDRAIHRYESG
jgi:flagellar motility protein MotE (MotC chaperone)